MKSGDEVRWLTAHGWRRAWLAKSGQRRCRIRSTPGRGDAGSYEWSAATVDVRLPTPEEAAEQALIDRRHRVASRSIAVFYADLIRIGDDHAWVDRVEAWLDAMPRREP